MRIYDFGEYSKVVYISSFYGKIINIKKAIESIKDTIIICTGDLQIGRIDFEDDVDRISSLQYILSDNNCNLVIIRGNHDNPKYFKRRSTFINRIKEVAPNIYLAQDYSVVHLENQNILCIGGARSINRFNLYKNIDWWQNENVQSPSDDFYEELENSNLKIDVIVSHTAPLFAKPVEFSNKLKHYNSYLMNACAMYDSEMKNDVYLERLLLKGIYEKLNNKNHIKYYVYGHYNKFFEYPYNKTNFISLEKNDVKEYVI